MKKYSVFLKEDGRAVSVAGVNAILFVENSQSAAASHEVSSNKTKEA